MPILVSQLTPIVSLPRNAESWDILWRCEICLLVQLAGPCLKNSQLLRYQIPINPAPEPVRSRILSRCHQPVSSWSCQEYQCLAGKNVDMFDGFVQPMTASESNNCPPPSVPRILIMERLLTPNLGWKQSCQAKFVWNFRSFLLTHTNGRFRL